MKQIPEPWKSFFEDIDESLQEEVWLEILGGFVIAVIYGSSRTTSDIDVVSVIPNDNVNGLVTYAGEGSKLHKRHGVYFDQVGITNLPENYEDRRMEVFAGHYKNLRFIALSPYDVALGKIERNIDRDREDVRFLAQTVPLDLEKLKEIYKKELRPILENPEREDLTLKLWIEMIEEDRMN